MRDLLNDIEKAAEKLQNVGERAVQSAAERLNELKPVIREGVDKAVDSAKDVFDKTGDGIERAMQEAKAALGQALDRLTDADDVPASQPAEEPEAPEKPLSPTDEIDLDVEAQVSKIRASQQAPGAFSDYIAQKYGKDKQ